MTTTAKTTAADTMLAIDLGKYQSGACLYRSPREQRFTTIPTSRAELTRLIDQHRPAVVRIEAGLLAGWVRDLCAELGGTCRVAHTASEAWKVKHLQRKADKDDALRLAEVYLLGQFPAVTVPAKEVPAKRAPSEARQQLVGRRVALPNRSRSILVGQGLPAPCAHKAWTGAGLAGLAAHARPIADCGPLALWRGRLQLALAELEHVKGLLDPAERKLDELAKGDAGMQSLDTIPGVGPRTAEAVVAFLPEPKRFRTTKQVSA